MLMRRARAWRNDRPKFGAERAATQGSFPRAARTGENPAESDQNAATPPPGVGTCVLRNKIEADLRFRGLWTPIRPHTRQKKLIVSAFWGCSGAVLAPVETSPQQAFPACCFAAHCWGGRVCGEINEIMRYIIPPVPPCLIAAHLQPPAAAAARTHAHACTTNPAGRGRTAAG